MTHFLGERELASQARALSLGQQGGTVALDERHSAEVHLESVQHFQALQLAGALCGNGATRFEPAGGAARLLVLLRHLAGQLGFHLLLDLDRFTPLQGDHAFVPGQR